MGREETRREERKQGQRRGADYINQGKDARMRLTLTWTNTHHMLKHAFKAFQMFSWLHMTEFIEPKLHVQTYSIFFTGLNWKQWQWRSLTVLRNTFFSDFWRKKVEYLLCDEHDRWHKDQQSVITWQYLKFTDFSDNQSYDAVLIEAVHVELCVCVSTLNYWELTSSSCFCHHTQTISLDSELRIRSGSQFCFSPRTLGDSIVYTVLYHTTPRYRCYTT